MSILGNISSRKLCRALEKLGFEAVRQKGSHVFYRHPDGRTTVVPVHKGENLGKGLITQILRDIDITTDELIEQL